jgi:hypothetical protein
LSVSTPSTKASTGLNVAVSISETLILPTMKKGARKNSSRKSIGSAMTAVRPLSRPRASELAMRLGPPMTMPAAALLRQHHVGRR